MGRPLRARAGQLPRRDAVGVRPQSNFRIEPCQRPGILLGSARSDYGRPALVEVALDALTALPNEPGKAGQASVAARARGLIGLSQMNYGDGEYQTGLAACHEAVRLLPGVGRPVRSGDCAQHVGKYAAFQGDSDLAEHALIEAVQIGHALENPALLAFATGVLGQYVYMPRGDLEAAWRSTEESLQYARLAGMTWSVAQGELIFARIAALKESLRLPAHTPRFLRK